MSDIKKALRKLGTKCIEAGHVVKGNTVGEILDCIADHYAGGSGSNLPTVTAADNDKVLTVVNGAWDKAAASESESVVYLEVTLNEDGTAISSVKNGETDVYFEQIFALYSDGKNIIARINVADHTYAFFPLTTTSDDTVDHPLCVFSNVVSSGFGMGVYFYEAKISKSTEATPYTLTQKTLTVSS